MHLLRIAMFLNPTIQHSLKKHNLNICSEDKRLPYLYCLAKLCKRTAGSRYIIVAPKYSIKPLLKTLTPILRLDFNHVKAYIDKYTCFSGVKTFWTVLNKNPVID